jgi:Na+/H+ antiporter NhaA
MGLLGIFGVIVAAMIGVPVRAASTIDAFVASTSGFGANPVAFMLLPLSAFRIGGSTLESASLAAPNPASLGTATVAGLIWTTLHVLVSLALYRRLFVTYRTRFDW